MKIAIIRGSSLNPWEMQNYEPLAKRHEILAITSKKPAYEINQVKLPIKKLRCLGEIFNLFPGGISLLYRTLGDPQYLSGLEKTLVGFDIAHVAETGSGYSFQAIKAKEKGLVKKVVVTVWENIPFLGEEKPKRKAIRQFVLANADHFLAVGKGAQKALLMEGAKKEKITVIPMGIDLKKFKPASKDWQLAKILGIKKDDLVVLSVGRLVWEKGFFDLLYTAKRLVTDQKVKDKNLKFVLIGQGPEKENLVSLVKRLGLKKRVVFTSYLSYYQMSRVYNLADVFVLASIPIATWQEQFGMVLAEAMASGLPIVATKTGEIPNVVGQAGILVPPGDWRRLTEGLKKIILDQRYRRILAQRSRERAEKQFDHLMVARKIEKVYQELT